MLTLIFIVTKAETVVLCAKVLPEYRLIYALNYGKLIFMNKNIKIFADPIKL